MKCTYFCGMDEMESTHIFMDGGSSILHLCESVAHGSIEFATTLELSQYAVLMLLGILEIMSKG